MANIRMDTITSIDLKSKRYTFLANGVSTQSVLALPSNKAVEIDSIYIHSNESTTTCIAKLIVNSTIGAATSNPGRSFFVARMAPKETCLAVSKSTPLFMEYDEVLQLQFFSEDWPGTTSPPYTCSVVMSYREYGI